MVKSVKETFSKILFLICALFGVFAVLVISIYLLAKGIPAIAEIGFFKFIFGMNWFPDSNEFGIFPMIVNTLYVTAFAVIFGVGIGVFSAIFMAKFCPKKIYKPLKQIINLLAGIPSVVYGFFGIQLLIPFLSLFSSTGGYGLMASGITLGIMILPTVISISINSINSVPSSYYEGAVALGATHEQAVFKVVVPAAKSGILSSVILGIGRAMGETMAVVMVSGNLTKIPTGFFEALRTLTGNIVFEMPYAEGLHLGALIATGVVLFVFVLIITICFNIYMSKSQKPRDKRKKINLQNGSDGGLEIKSEFVVKQKLAMVLKVVAIVSICLTVAFLGLIVGFVLIKGIPHINFKFLFGTFSYDGPITILPSLVTTLLLIIVTLVISVPLGVCAAIYLSEYTKRGSKIVKIIRSGIETLSGIPSIIFGLFGMLMFCNAFKFGASILAGCLTLSLMILPTIIRTTEETLKSVPDSYREGSMALGASKTTTIFKVVFPSAIAGIVTSIVLSIGRIVGESAAVLFTVGGTQSMPNGLMSSGISLAVFMYVLAGESFHVNEAYAVAVVLIVLVVVLNLASGLLEKAFSKKINGDKQKTKKMKELIPEVVETV